MQVGFSEEINCVLFLWGGDEYDCALLVMVESSTKPIGFENKAESGGSSTDDDNDHGQSPSSLSENTILWAYGRTNVLGYHVGRAFLTSHIPIWTTMQQFQQRICCPKEEKLVRSGDPNIKAVKPNVKTENLPLRCVLGPATVTNFQRSIRVDKKK